MRHLPYMATKKAVAADGWDSKCARISIAVTEFGTGIFQLGWEGWWILLTGPA